MAYCLILINHGQILFDGSLVDFKINYEKNTLTEAMRAAFSEIKSPTV